ncbi:hypothetical protein LTR15_004470 [Elasticomyces elasticus]|nr:hypothetical protein LTR15_004470 [Elasticomyces elasticus]
MAATHGHGHWKDVLNGTDVATARLIIRMQLEDIGALAPDRQEPAAKRRRLDDDTAVASRLYLDELRACNADLPGRQLGEEIEEHENACQHALEAAAFGWHYDENADRVERAVERVTVTCVACSDTYDQNQILRSRFGSKRIELETKDRTYCHISTCSAFIRPQAFFGTQAPCPVQFAHGSTCTLCKQAFHYGPCPRNAELETLINTAQQNQWKQCFACHRMVELKTGCNHITCFCRTEFCYVCGLRWKTCRCVQWDEARLLERAEAVIDNRPAPAPQAPRAQLPNGPAQQQPPALPVVPARAEQVANAVQHLRDNHECVHEGFNRLREPGREWDCETCGETYYTWIYECRQCWMIMCNNCRRNRI